MDAGQTGDMCAQVMLSMSKAVLHELGKVCAKAQLPGSSPGSGTYQLCDLEQVSFFFIPQLIHLQNEDNL